MFEWGLLFIIITALAISSSVIKGWGGFIGACATCFMLLIGSWLPLGEPEPYWNQHGRVLQFHVDEMGDNIYLWILIENEKPKYVAMPFDLKTAKGLQESFRKQEEYGGRVMFRKGEGTEAPGILYDDMRVIEHNEYKSRDSS